MAGPTFLGRKYYAKMLRLKRKSWEKEFAVREGYFQVKLLFDQSQYREKTSRSGVEGGGVGAQAQDDYLPLD